MIIHYQNSTVQPLKFVNWYVISTHTLLDMLLFTYAGKLIQVDKRGPW